MTNLHNMDFSSVLSGCCLETFQSKSGIAIELATHILQNDRHTHHYSRGWPEISSEYRKSCGCSCVDILY